MNVTIIYGTAEKSSTYNCVEILLKNLRFSMNINVSEFFLPEESPYLCYGHLSNFDNKKSIYSYQNNINSIMKSLEESDLIILASPVLSCDISTEMKSFLNYLSQNFPKNKEKSIMCNKIGLVLSTATGAGLFNTIKTLRRTLKLWGVRNTFTFSKTIYAINWDDVTLKTKIKINNRLFKLSNKLLHSYNKLHPIKTNLFSKVTFSNNNNDHTLNDCPRNIIDFKHFQKESYLKERNI